MISDIKKFNPDIIHITNNHPYSIILHIFLKNYTFITTVHNITPNKGEVGSLTRLLLNFTKIITFNKSSKLIVHGKSLKKELMKYVPIEKIEIIPHGNYSFFTQFAEGKIQHQKNNILFFGRILDYKGLEYLIQALPLINDKIPDAIITIAGEGNFEKYYPLIKNRDKFEIFNEYISDKKVAELFSKASVVVLPYIDGSQSGIIAIAYSFGKPVITTNVGSISEVVENGKTGFIIQPKNSQQLAEAAITILRDENLLNSMSERAHIKSKEFSWDAIALKHIAVYNRALIE
jgi:glycosyltransferase involved in cell wall biosynthesis